MDSLLRDNKRYRANGKRVSYANEVSKLGIQSKKDNRISSDHSHYVDQEITKAKAKQDVSPPEGSERFYIGLDLLVVPKTVMESIPLGGEGDCNQAIQDKVNGIQVNDQLHIFSSDSDDNTTSLSDKVIGIHVESRILDSSSPGWEEKISSQGSLFNYLDR